MSMEITFMRGKQSTSFLNNYWLPLWLRRNTSIQDLNEDYGWIAVGLLAKLVQDIRTVLEIPSLGRSILPNPGKTEPDYGDCYFKQLSEAERKIQEILSANTGDPILVWGSY